LLAMAVGEPQGGRLVIRMPRSSRTLRPVTQRRQDRMPRAQSPMQAQRIARPEIRRTVGEGCGCHASRSPDLLLVLGVVFALRGKRHLMR
jgi:hypothetical protein